MKSQHNIPLLCEGANIIDASDLSRVAALERSHGQKGLLPNSAGGAIERSPGQRPG